MRHLLIALAAFGLAVPVAAQDAAPVKIKSGQIVRDANMAKLGEVSSVLSDGSVQIIYEQRLVTLPASTLSVVDGKPKTSLSRSDLSKM